MLRLVAGKGVVGRLGGVTRRRRSRPRRLRSGAFGSGDPPWPGGGPGPRTPSRRPVAAEVAAASPRPALGRPRRTEGVVRRQGSYGADLGRVDGGGVPGLPWLNMPPPEARVEVLDAVLANGGRGEVRERHGQRNVGTVMHRVRRARRYVHRPPWRQGVRRRPPEAAFSIRPWEPSQYLSNSCRDRVALPPSDADRLLPLTIINRLCSMSKWTGVTEFGEETNTNATRFCILPCLVALPGDHPDSSWPRLVFMSSAMPGSSSTLSRVSQAFALRRSRMTSPGRSKAPRGGALLAEPEGAALRCRRSLIDAAACRRDPRLPRGSGGHQVEFMGEFRGCPGKSSSKEAVLLSWGPALAVVHP